MVKSANVRYSSFQLWRVSTKNKGCIQRTPELAAVCLLRREMAACPICGKILRSGSDEALSAHQRESQSCYARPNKSDSSAVKELEARLASVIAAGKTLGEGSGTFEQSERNTAERIEVERLLKQVRASSPHREPGSTGVSVHGAL